MPGWRRRSSASTGGNRNAAFTSLAVSVIVPSTDSACPDAESETIARLGPGANPIAIDDDGNVFVAQAQLGDKLYRLDADDPGEPEVLNPAPGQVNAFAFGEDGRLYSPRFVDGVGIVAAIDPASGEAENITEGLPLTVSVRVAPDGTLRALTVGPGKVWMVDPATGGWSEVCGGWSTAHLVGHGANLYSFESNGSLYKIYL